MGAGASLHKLKMSSATATTPTKRRLLLIHQHKSKRAPLCLRMKLLLILLFDLLSQSLQSKEQNLKWVSVIIYFLGVEMAEGHLFEEKFLLQSYFCQTQQYQIFSADAMLQHRLRSLRSLRVSLYPARLPYTAAIGAWYK